MAAARKFGGTVINADAMQVYRDLSVLTARPSAADETAVPHALYGTIDAADAFSVARYVEACRDAITAARTEGRVPVLVGGTGLYLAALFEGLSPLPPVPASIRERWRKAQAEQPPEALHAELQQRDPAMAATLRPTDPQRIVRALEVIDGTGRSLLSWQAEKGPALLSPEATRRIVIAPDRASLRDTIAARFDAMVVAGAVDEAVALTARGLPPDLPAMKAIGVRPLAAAASGAIPMADAIAQSVTETRQYAKRQETWFRHRFADWPRAPTADAAFRALQKE